MDFGKAIKKMKKGEKVARKGWNGKNMYIFLIKEDDELLERMDRWTLNPKRTSQPFIVMKTADDKLQPGWLASQSDILAEDWEIVE
jgi:hypothetical protein